MDLIFLQWIELLYKEQTAEIQYAVCRSTKINIVHGVHQGCPLSPLLFIVVIEILALTVKQCSDIHGVRIDSKISLHADDIALFLQKPIISLFDFCSVVSRTKAQLKAAHN